MRLIHGLACIFPALQALALVVEPDAKCYLPNGNEKPSTKPCLSNSGDGHSHCCDPVTEVCLDNGLCYVQTTGDTARETCTDQNWQASSCPSYCRETYVNSGCGMVGKLYINGQAQWCCQQLSSDGSCQTNGGAFTLEPGKVINGWGPLNNSANLLAATGSACPPASTVLINSSGTPSLSSMKASETACVTNDGESKATVAAVGAGVGVPLAIALCAVSFLLFRERRRAKTLGLQAPEALYKGQAPNYTDSHAQGARNTAYPTLHPAEMEHSEYRPELQ